MESNRVSRLRLLLRYHRLSPGTRREPVLGKKGGENVAEVFRPPFGVVGRKEWKAEALRYIVIGSGRACSALLKAVRSHPCGQDVTEQQ